MFRGGTTTFDKLLDKATSHTLLEPDLSSIIQISDLIRQGDCPPKYALASIKKKLINTNSHTVGYALVVLESVVKNCGHIIHDEVATKAFMEILQDLLTSSSDDKVKQKTLELIQTWAHAFRSTPKYRPVQDKMIALKAGGYKFPVLKESDAMFAAETAPDWVDSPTCHRCRVQFGVVQRKHHCRACGNVVCGQCSGKTATLPKFGIEKEVRVCDTCYDQNKNRAASPTGKVETEQLPAEYVNSSLAQQKQAKPAMSTEEMNEEDELQLVLALSQSEAEAKEMEKKRPTSELNNSSQQKSSIVVTQKEEEDPEDAELARYLNRSYWEQRQGQPSDKNRSVSPDRYRNSPPSAPETPTHQMENGLSEAQLGEFVAYLKSQVEIFVNRMKSNSSRGRNISNDSSVQSLFMNMTNNHSKLLEFISQQEEMRVHFEGLQDKLAQIKDALAALEALRDEHQEKLRREAEEAERLKQIQMAHKLQIMRKKKQEYLQHQRQLAMERVQEQEREMQMRKEQQKQQYMMGGMGSYMMGYGPQGPGYPPQGPLQGPPVYPQQQLPNYMPQGYPPGAVIHPGMGIPPHMQQGRLPPGPHSLPPQMPPHLQQMQQPPSLPQQPMGMGQQHSGLPPQNSAMTGMQHAQQNPSMQQPPSLPQQPIMAQQNSIMPGLHPGYPVIPNQHPGMGPPMGPMHGQEVPMQMQGAPPGPPGSQGPRMMHHGGQQFPQTPPGAPLEQQPTVELIRFD